MVERKSPGRVGGRGGGGSTSDTALLNGPLIIHRECIMATETETHVSRQKLLSEHTIYICNLCSQFMKDDGMT